jgi:hypothetical protein
MVLPMGRALSGLALCCMVGGSMSVAQNNPISAHAITLDQLNRLTPATLQPVVKAAQAAPPEFAADVLIRLAAALPPTQIEARKRFLDAAWTLSDNAPRLYARQPVASYHLQGTAGDRTYQSHLDALSLKSRIVEALIPLDPAAALDRYRSISLTRLPVRHDCKVSSVGDPTAYYETGKMLLKALPERTGRLTMLKQWSEEAGSDLQIGPVLDLYIAFGEKWGSDAPRMTMQLTSMFDRVRGDDQTFSVSFTTVGARYPLVAHELEAGSTSAKILTDSYRAYLLAHFNGPRCQANVESESFAQEHILLDTGDPSLNLSSKDDTPNGVIPQETGAPPLEAPVGEEYFTQGWTVAQGILDGPPGKPVGDDSEKALAGFLNSLKYPTASDDESFNLYRSRCAALRRFIELMPPGKEKTAAASVFFDLVDNSPIYKSDRDDWYFEAQDLVMGAEGLPQAERVPLVVKLTSSRNPTLHLYGEFEAWKYHVQPDTSSN